MWKVSTPSSPTHHGQGCYYTRLILHFSSLKPTWLLFDADWAFNKRSGQYLEQCSDIVAVGRLRWIEGTTTTGKDNAAWYRFDARHFNGTIFHGRNI